MNAMKGIEWSRCTQHGTKVIMMCVVMVCGFASKFRSRVKIRDVIMTKARTKTTNSYVDVDFVPSVASPTYVVL